MDSSVGLELESPGGDGWSFEEQAGSFNPNSEIKKRVVMAKGFRQ
jgi:hypothetical protein